MSSLLEEIGADTPIIKIGFALKEAVTYTTLNDPRPTEKVVTDTLKNHRKRLREMEDDIKTIKRVRFADDQEQRLSNIEKILTAFLKTLQESLQ